MSIKTHSACYMGAWVAELGSLSSGAKMAMKIFVKRFLQFSPQKRRFARNRKFAKLTQ